MLQRFRSALLLRLSIVLIVLHVGIFAALSGLWRLSPVETSLPPGTLGLLTGGIATLYGSFVLAALLILVPAWPWIQRARRLHDWRTWFLEILPQVLAVAPIVIAGAKILVAAWKEFQESGDWTHLDPDQLAAKIVRGTRPERKSAKRSHQE